ncbi:hypothetical protein [Lentzea sp. NPDC003310]|uniref:hypothetical protein n=1 Tax=Lentzea sp. NPDC003310 TaxID=3154447 RepID=UPI0033A52E80
MPPQVEFHLVRTAEIVYPPSSATGPHPVAVQISGHAVTVDVTAVEEVAVHSLGFRVVNRHPTRSGTVSMCFNPAPEPNLRFWLDEPTRTAHGPVRLDWPVTIRRGRSRQFVVSAHTKKHDVEWELSITVDWGAGLHQMTCRVRTTAETGMVRFSPDGTTSVAKIHAEPDRPEDSSARP